MKEKRIYHKARMFSVELTSQSQLLSASSVSVSGSTSAPGLQLGNYNVIYENVFE